jgi:predicted GNAT family N-acyltransferase
VKIGRMAVDKVLRGCGFGEGVLKALAGEAHALGDKVVILHAQRTAQKFYAKLGFDAHGEPFEEAGIPHQEMHCALPLAH